VRQLPIVPSTIQREIASDRHITAIQLEVTDAIGDVIISRQKVVVEEDKEVNIRRQGGNRCISLSSCAEDAGDYFDGNVC
jgi:hypothetical protein